MKNSSVMTNSRFRGRLFAGAFLSAAMGLVWMGCLEKARAQFPAPTVVKADIQDVKVVMQRTPEFAGSTSENKKDPKKREWLELEVEFKTVSDSAVGLIPELMISYYVLVDGVTRQVLNGSFTYTNIVDKEDNFAVVYVSPNGLTRLAGEPNKFRLGDVKAWAVEILYKGRVVAESPDMKKFNAAASIPRATDLLLPKEKTPFELLWIDRHVELKAE